MPSVLFPLSAQLGPLGSSPVITAAGAFDPSTIAGLKLWLKADAEAYNDGDAVTTWHDQSGNSNNAGGGVSPTFKTGIVNSLPVVRFNGSSNYLTSSTNVTAGAPRTVFAAVISTTATGGTVLTTRITNGAASYLTRLLRLGGVSYVAGDGTATDCTIAEDESTAWQSWSYATWKEDSSRNTSFYFNGSQKTVSGNPVVVEAGASGYLLGQIQSAQQFWSGDMAEILVYDTALGDTDRGNVESYLKTKYGL